ncbi:MAG: hypothetical protein AABY06_02930 [Nanoarchaeota archaeon]
MVKTLLDIAGCINLNGGNLSSQERYTPKSTSYQENNSDCNDNCNCTDCPSDCYCTDCNEGSDSD